jgi:hypothetical protein
LLEILFAIYFLVNTLPGARKRAKPVPKIEIVAVFGLGIHFGSQRAMITQTAGHCQYSAAFFYNLLSYALSPQTWVGPLPTFMYEVGHL